jgi:hypothetical protein
MNPYGELINTMERGRRCNASPITYNLDLSCMCAEELHIGVGMVEERYNQTPCLRLLLYLDQLLLNPPLIHLGLGSRVSLLYQLGKRRKKCAETGVDLRYILELLVARRMETKLAGNL